MGRGFQILDFVFAEFAALTNAHLKKVFRRSLPLLSLMATSFYRRPLPTDTCIDFSSPEGKVLFTDALKHGKLIPMWQNSSPGYLESYYRFASAT